MNVKLKDKIIFSKNFKLKKKLILNSFKKTLNKGLKNKKMVFNNNIKVSVQFFSFWK